MSSTAELVFALLGVGLVAAPLGAQTLGFPLPRPIAWLVFLGGAICIIVGLALPVWRWIWPDTPAISEVPSSILSSQVEQLTELQGLFAAKSELDLWNQFDFPNLEALNIRWVADRLIHVRTTGDTQNFGIAPYMSAGASLQLDTTIIGTRLRTIPSGLLAEPDFSRVQYIILTPAYSSALKHLQSYESSVVLPALVIVAVKRLDATVQKDVSILHHILDSSLRDDPDALINASVPALPGFGVINNQFVHQAIGLKGEADQIVEAGRAYLKVDQPQ